MILSRMRHEFRAWVGLYPTIFYSIFWLKRTNRPLIVRRDSEIVIEGYPRSANTFAVIAFKQAQRRDVRIAHHLHVPAQLVRAARWNIPAILLLRDPIDAVTSLLVRYPYDHPRRMLRDYIRFYRRLYPLRSHFVLAEFNDVTKDYGAVIRQVNARFGTSFVPFQHSEGNVDGVFRGVDDVFRARGGKGNEIAKPTPEKEALKRAARERLACPTLVGLREEARAWYERYIRDLHAG